MPEATSTFSITLIAGVICVLLGGFVSIKIKYAETAEEAKRGLVRLGFLLLSYVGVVAISYDLYLQVTSEEPLVRADVFSIVIDVSVLTLWIIISILQLFLDLFGRIVRTQLRMLDLHEDHANLHKEHIENIKTIIGSDQ